VGRYPRSEGGEGVAGGEASRQIGHQQLVRIARQSERFVGEGELPGLRVVDEFGAVGLGADLLLGPVAYEVVAGDC